MDCMNLKHTVNVTYLSQENCLFAPSIFVNFIKIVRPVILCRTNCAPKYTSNQNHIIAVTDEHVLNLASFHFAAVF